MDGYMHIKSVWVPAAWVWAFLRANPIILRRGYEGPVWIWLYYN